MNAITSKEENETYRLFCYYFQAYTSENSNSDSSSRDIHICSLSSWLELRLAAISDLTFVLVHL